MITTETTERRTVTGTLRCVRTPRHHNGKDWLVVYLKDQANPLPPYEFWYISTDEPSKHRKLTKQIKLKSGRLPKAMDEDMENKKISFTATLVPYHNGLGYYMSKVTDVHLAD